MSTLIIFLKKIYVNDYVLIETRELDLGSHRFEFREEYGMYYVEEVPCPTNNNILHINLTMAGF